MFFRMEDAGNVAVVTVYGSLDHIDYNDYDAMSDILVDILMSLEMDPW